MNRRSISNGFYFKLHFFTLPFSANLITRFFFLFVQKYVGSTSEESFPYINVPPATREKSGSKIEDDNDDDPVSPLNFVEWHTSSVGIERLMQHKFSSMIKLDRNFINLLFYRITRQSMFLNRLQM